MRFIPDGTGRFARRPFYENFEMEVECESVVSDFLIGLRGKVEYPLSTDDLTVMIERYAALDLYATFEDDDVHGVTIFMPGKKPEVRIDARLTDDARRINRLRTTLAHEFGHVRLHNILFQKDAGGISLFEFAQPFEQTCRPKGLAIARGRDWMESQAGYVCTALLAPARRVADLLDRIGLPAGPIDPTGPSANRAIEAAMEAFAISRDAARVRLSVLGRLGDGRQGSLLVAGQEDTP